MPSGSVTGKLKKKNLGNMKDCSVLILGKVSDLMYVNIHMPYWYFNIEDPDGNIIEITGKM